MARKKETYTYLSKKKKPFYRKKIFLISLIFLSVGLLGWYKVNASPKEYVIKISEAKKKGTKQASFNKGVFKDKDVEISFNSVELGTDVLKNPIVYTFFNITNKTKEPLKTKVAFKDHIDIYQDLDNSLKPLNQSYSPGSEFKDELNVMDELIKPGATVEVAYASILYKEDLPISIKFVDNKIDRNTVGTLKVELEDK